MTIFLPGRLRNPLNGTWGDWRKHARVARDWRERTAQHILCETRSLGAPTLPKRVTFLAWVGRLWDTDNLPAAIKPIRDGLVDGRVIHSDGPESGHEFLYAQQVDHKIRGVTVTWTLQ